MITYNDIYDALRKEKEAKKLESLNRKFIQNVSEYLKEKKEFLKKQDKSSSSADKIRKQRENAISIFKELMSRRKKKILNLAFVTKETEISDRNFENMLDFEKEMFNKIIKDIESTDKRINKIFNGEEKIKKEKEETSEVKFNENVGEFLDSEGNKIGPFESGEKTTLPDNIIKILKKDNKVRLLEED